MRFVIQSILLATLLLLAVGFSANVQAGQKYAFLVGVGGYDEKQLKKLPYAKADIVEFRDLLLESGFPKDNVVMLVDDLSALPKSGTAGRYLPEHKKIRDELSILLPALEPDDELVIGLAGHGIQFQGDDNPYFCPLDADLTDKATLISLNWLYDQLKYDKQTRTGCPARAKLLIVDACRKDPETSIRRNSGGPELASLTKPQLAEPPAGVVALFSCAEGQEAMEHDPLKHGVFFYHVLEGLKGAADGDEDTNVTLDEVIAYTKARTARYVRRELRAAQTPRQKGYFDGTWTLRSLGPPITLTNRTGMQLKLIPAGSFMMGSSRSAKEVAAKYEKYGAKESYYTDEHPRHRVTLTKPFYMGIHEVTRGQFAAFVRDQNYKTEPERDGEGGYGWNEADDIIEGRDPKYNWKNTGFPQTDDHPVVNVTWNDAVAFCEWLSRKEGRKYRLPTEAEWEYACRAGTTTDFHNGDDPDQLVKVGNVADATARAKHSGWTTLSTADGQVFTSPVGRFQANAFGLFDMHGNVYEWCSDWRGSDYYENSPGVDPRGPSSGSFRVLRGGSWLNEPRNVRSAFRSFHYAPGSRYDGIGFRVVSESE